MPARICITFVDQHEGYEGEGKDEGEDEEGEGGKIDFTSVCMFAIVSSGD